MTISNKEIDLAIFETFCKFLKFQFHHIFRCGFSCWSYSFKIVVPKSQKYATSNFRKILKKIPVKLHAEGLHLSQRWTAINGKILLKFRDFQNVYFSEDLRLVTSYLLKIFLCNLCSSDYIYHCNLFI